MSEKRIIGLVGQIACGKGAIAKHAKKNHNASTYKFSTILRDILNRLHLEISRENLNDLSVSLRTKFGEDTLAKVIAKDVDEDTSELIVVDGIRRMKDIEYLKKLPGFKLVRIVVDPKIRYERLVLRNENEGDDKKTFEELLADQKKNSDAEIPEVMEHADLEINNNGTWEEFQAEIKNVQSRLSQNIITAKFQHK
jgi:dephospho-CoA kinase